MLMQIDSRFLQSKAIASKVWIGATIADISAIADNHMNMYNSCNVKLNMNQLLDCVTLQALYECNIDSRMETWRKHAVKGDYRGFKLATPRVTYKAIRDYVAKYWEAKLADQLN